MSQKLLILFRLVKVNGARCWFLLLTTALVGGKTKHRFSRKANTHLYSYIGASSRGRHEPFSGNRSFDAALIGGCIDLNKQSIVK